MKLPHLFAFDFASDRLNILMLFFLALIVRCLALEHIFLISRDGIRFLTIANFFSSGTFLKGLADAYHPLYPLLISLFGCPSGNCEFTGQLISLTLSSLTVIFVYLIGKTIYDNKTGLIAGLFFIMQPQCVRCSVDVLSDATFLFFLVTAFYLGIKGEKEEKNFLWWCLGAGICSGLAYLTRPEGIFLVLFFPGWYLLGWIFHNKKITRVLAAGGVLLFGFFLFAAPYLLFIKNHTGTWQISMKQSVVSMVHSLQKNTAGKTEISSSQHRATKPPAPAGSPESAEVQPLSPIKPREPFHGGDIWKSVTYTPFKFIETYHFLLFLFLFFGILAEAQRKEKTSGIMLLLFVTIYLMGLCYLYYTVSYVSRRHFLPAIIISLPLAGFGFWEIQRRFLRWMTRCGFADFSAGRKTAPRLTKIILVITLLILVSTTLQPQGKDKLPLKQAALWIKNNKEKSSPIIMSNEPLVGYYAGGKNLLIPALTYSDFVNCIDTAQVDYLVFSERDITNGKDFLPLLQPEKFKRVAWGNKKVLIYEISR